MIPTPWRPVCAALLLGTFVIAPAAARSSKEASRSAAKAPALTAEAINTAALAPQGGRVEGGKSGAKKAAARARKSGAAGEKADPLIVKAQVLLDRAHFYPGAIDGRKGDNYQRALSAFAVAQGLPATHDLTPEVWDKLQATSDKPVVTDYTLTDADVSGPYVDKIPPKMEEQADLKELGYTNPREMLAERFHMSRDLVLSLIHI